MGYVPYKRKRCVAHRMGNINSIAVCVLSDCACVVLTENASLDEDAKLKAEAMSIPVFQSEKSAYDLAVEISKLL